MNVCERSRHQGAKGFTLEVDVNPDNEDDRHKDAAGLRAPSRGGRCERTELLTRFLFGDLIGRRRRRRQRRVVCAADGSTCRGGGSDAGNGWHYPKRGGGGVGHQLSGVAVWRRHRKRAVWEVAERRWQWEVAEGGSAGQGARGRLGRVIPETKSHVDFLTS